MKRLGEILGTLVGLTMFAFVALIPISFAVTAWREHKALNTKYDTEQECEDATGLLCQYVPARQTGEAYMYAFWYPVER